MKSKYYILSATLIVCGVLLPRSADAFSLTTLVEAHQERMQRSYEQLSARLCTAVSSLLPFVASDVWCTGKGAKNPVVSEPSETLLLPPSELLFLEAAIDAAAPTHFFSGDITATTSTSTSLH